MLVSTSAARQQSCSPKMRREGLRRILLSSPTCCARAKGLRKGDALTGTSALSHHDDAMLGCALRALLGAPLTGISAQSLAPPWPLLRPTLAALRCYRPTVAPSDAAMRNQRFDWALWVL